MNQLLPKLKLIGKKKNHMNAFYNTPHAKAFGLEVYTIPILAYLVLNLTFFIRTKER